MNGMMGKMGCGPDMMKKGMEMREKMIASGFNPQEMCRQMTSAVAKAAEMGSYATPEIRALFEDWVCEVEKEIMAFIRENNQVTPADIAKKLKISEDSSVFFISRLARQKKIKITGLEICDTSAETKEPPVDEQKEADNGGGG